MPWMERRSSMALPSWRMRRTSAGWDPGSTGTIWEPRCQERLLGLDAAVALRCHVPSAGVFWATGEHIHTISSFGLFWGS